MMFEGDDNLLYVEGHARQGRGNAVGGKLGLSMQNGHK